MTTRVMLLAAAVVILPATAIAQEWAHFPPAPEPIRRSVTMVNYQHEERLKALRKEGLALQAADGGTLTPAHRNELQAKLDDLWASYRRNVARAEPWP